jgi:Domain of Unknown Function (DUF1080)
MTPEGDSPPAGWEVRAGEPHLSPNESGPGPLITQCEYANFRLDFTWRIEQGGNHGIKYRVRNYDGRWLGCEYQILDDHDFPEPLQDDQFTGALYDVYAPSASRELHPHGQYNHGAIVVRGARIEHWLNGKRIVCVTAGDGDWQRHIAESKFHDVPGFGTIPCGRIMLTDHHSQVWFRSITLTPLDSPIAVSRSLGSSPPARRRLLPLRQRRCPIVGTRFRLT